MYVNYYNCEISGKDDLVVKYTLGDHGEQIFTGKYQFYLPAEEELTKELKEIKHQQDNKNIK